MTPGQLVPPGMLTGKSGIAVLIVLGVALAMALAASNAASAPGGSDKSPLFR